MNNIYATIIERFEQINEVDLRNMIQEGNTGKVFFKFKNIDALLFRGNDKVECGILYHNKFTANNITNLIDFQNEIKEILDKLSVEVQKYNIPKHRPVK